MKVTMNSAFNDQILAEKLKKLNNSQQSIETLSHWCIFHRKKAHLVVETWDKQLRVLPKEQRIPFLYLANDILQNSRRRGGEFVIEFWKVLPGALKNVLEKGDDQAQSVVLRLVDIWDDRKVFGIRAKTLREELLGAEPPTELSEQHLKSNNNFKLKVAVSSLPESLISAYRSAENAASEEETSLSRCHAVAASIEGLEKETDTLSDKSILATTLQEQEEVVSHCIWQLETSEAAKIALISLLKEALKEQESKLELIRSQLQIAKGQVHHSEKLRQQFLARRSSSPPAEHLAPIDDKLDMKMGYLKSMAATDTAYQWPPLPPTEELHPYVDEFQSPPGITTSAAAEVAAKLAASSSSAQVLASVLSSMVGEEASNVRTASAPIEAPSNINFSEKRQRMEEESDFVRSSESSSAFMNQLPPPPPPLQGTGGAQYYSGSVQMYSPSPPQGQPHYPPLPPGLPQPTNMNTQGFGYANVLPRLPLASHPPMQGQVQSNTLQAPQVFNSGAYRGLRSPGIGFFNQQSLPTAHLPRH